MHFALLAGVLFLVASAVGDESEEIEIDPATVEATVAEIEASRGRMANGGSRELAGIRGPRRLRRLGKEQQSIERRLGDRRRG